MASCIDSSSVPKGSLPRVLFNAGARVVVPTQMDHRKAVVAFGGPFIEFLKFDTRVGSCFLSPGLMGCIAGKEKHPYVENQ